MKEISRFGEEPLRISLVSAHPIEMEGGVQNHILGYRDFLLSQGHNVLILTPKLSQYQAENGILYLGKAMRIPFQGTTAYTSLLPVNPFGLASIHRKFNPDIVHLHSPEVSVPSMQYVAQIQANYFATFHSQYDNRWMHNLWRPLGIVLGGKLSGKIAVSEASKTMHEAFYPGEYTIIPNGISMERFNPHTKPIVEFADGKFNIVFIGRHEERKGLHFLLRTYQKIRRETDEVRLIIVGDGALKGEYEDYVKTERIQDVHFEGRVKNEKIPSYYATARENGVYCSPAYKGESFGIVLLEAMASQVPVVGGDNEGYRLVVADRNEGILVNPQDTDLFFKEIINLMKNKELRQKMAYTGLKKAMLFDWNYVGKQILEYYEECLVTNAIYK